MCRCNQIYNLQIQKEHCTQFSKIFSEFVDVLTNSQITTTKTTFQGAITIVLLHPVYKQERLAKTTQNYIQSNKKMLFNCTSYVIKILL